MLKSHDLPSSSRQLYKEGAIPRYSFPEKKLRLREREDFIQGPTK